MEATMTKRQIKDRIAELKKEPDSPENYAEIGRMIRLLIGPPKTE